MCLSKLAYSGLNRLSAFDIEQPAMNSVRRAEFDNRLSLGGKGQIDTQRGLLNKDDLVIPDFLRDEDLMQPNDMDCNLNDGDTEAGFFDDGKIPTCSEAENIFRGGKCSTSSLFSAKSTSSLFQDITNQERLGDNNETSENQLKLKDESGDEGKELNTPFRQCVL